MREFRFKQLHGASAGNGLDIHHPPEPLNDSLNCRRLTPLPAASGSAAGGAFRNQEEPSEGAQMPHGAPGMAILPPELPDRDEQPGSG